MKGHYVGQDHIGLTETRCPLCGHRFDSAMGIDTDEGPEEGSLSVCIECAGVHVYNADLTLRSMSEQEWDELPADVRQQLTDAQAAIRAIHSQP